MQASVDVPFVALRAGIPRTIHQIFFMPDGTAADIPRPIQACIDRLRAQNPDWSHRLYDLAAIESFILNDYGADMLETFRSIDPRYGAARADLFRYLLMYKVGGVYLDIKSGLADPLDALIGDEDGYFLSQWDNQPGADHEGWGLHPALADLPGGEFQQWHIISSPGHPFLRATIESVVERIRNYALWRDGAGWGGVLLVTGPIAYTRAIRPLLSDQPCQRVRDHRSLGLIYTLVGGTTHERIFGAHYAQLSAPIVKPRGVKRLQTAAYLVARRMALVVIDRFLR